MIELAYYSPIQYIKRLTLRMAAERIQQKPHMGLRFGTLIVQTVSTAT